MMEAFMEWAFGRGFHQLKGDEMVDKWNERHGNVLAIDRKEDPKKVLPRMVEQYLKGRVDGRV